MLLPPLLEVLFPRCQGLSAVVFSDAKIAVRNPRVFSKSLGLADQDAAPGELTDASPAKPKGGFLSGARLRHNLNPGGVLSRSNFVD